jgi:glutaredoxin
MTARFRATFAGLAATALVGLGLGAPALAAPPPDGPEDCGIAPASAPDFALLDVNPTSASFGETVPRSSAPGRVTLLYFALPSCSHCQAQVEQLQALVLERDTAWAEVDVRIVALAAAEEAVPELADGTDLPILQDTDELDVQEQYNADR